MRTIRITHANTYSYSDRYSNRDGNCNCYADINTHSDSNGNSNRDGDCNCHTFCHGNTS